MEADNDNPRAVLLIGDLHVDDDRFVSAPRVVMIEESVLEANRRKEARNGLFQYRK